MDTIARDRSYDGEQWVQHTAKVFGGKDVHYVVLSNRVKVDDLPPAGTFVRFECSVKAYMSRDKSKAGYELTAWAVEVATAEPLLASS